MHDTDQNWPQWRGALCLPTDAQSWQAIPSTRLFALTSAYESSHWVTRVPDHRSATCSAQSSSTLWSFQRHWTNIDVFRAQVGRMKEHTLVSGNIFIADGPLREHFLNIWYDSGWMGHQSLITILFAAFQTILTFCIIFYSDRPIHCIQMHGISLNRETDKTRVLGLCHSFISCDTWGNINWRQRRKSVHFAVHIFFDALTLQQNWRSDGYG